MSLDISLVCPCCEETIYACNITHNLGEMAVVAGLYAPLWRPAENNIVYAWQLLEPIRAGLKELSNNPEKYDKLNPPNKWGSRVGFIEALEDLGKMCARHSTARVRSYQ
jgi:hypothetical protein